MIQKHDTSLINLIQDSIIEDMMTYCNHTGEEGSALCVERHGELLEDSGVLVISIQDGLYQGDEPTQSTEIR